MSKEVKKVEKVKEVKEPKPAKLKVPMDTRYISKLTMTLFVITAVTALLLGAVNHVTAPVIEQITREKTEQAMQVVLAAEDYSAVEGFVPDDSVTSVSKALDGGETIGYVCEVTSNGFGGAIDMVVGVGPDGCVTGVSVIDHGETQGVGSKVVKNQSVLDRFIGLTAGITVDAGDNRFDSVSGATVSSKGVTAGVNLALDAVAAYIQ